MNSTNTLFSEWKYFDIVNFLYTNHANITNFKSRFTLTAADMFPFLFHVISSNALQFTLTES